MLFPHPQLATPELEALRDRVGAFQQAVHEQQATTNLLSFLKGTKSACEQLLDGNAP
jgi:hypothetical protein